MVSHAEYIIGPAFVMAVPSTSERNYTAMTSDVPSAGVDNESVPWDVICRDDDESGLRVRHLSYAIDSGRAMVRDSRGGHWERLRNDGHSDSFERGSYVWVETSIRVGFNAPVVHVEKRRIGPEGPE